MMFGKLIDIGFAKLCAMCATPNHHGVFKNSGEAGSTQLCYTAYGSGEVTSVKGVASYRAGELTDVSHLRESQMDGISGPEGTIWVGINPNTPEMNLGHVYLRGQTSMSYTGVQSCAVLMCLRGSISANGKNLDELMFCRIFQGQEVQIEMSEDDIGILLWVDPQT